MTAESTSPHARGLEEMLSALDVDRERGLSSEEAARRLEEQGPNELRESTRRSTLAVLVDQFRSLVIAILGAAALSPASWSRPSRVSPSSPSSSLVRPRRRRLC